MQITRKQFILSTAAALTIGPLLTLRGAGKSGGDNQPKLSPHRRRLINSVANKRKQKARQRAAQKAAKARKEIARRANKNVFRKKELHAELASLKARSQKLNTILALSRPQRKQIRYYLKQQGPEIRAVRLNGSLASAAKHVQIEAIRRRTRHLIRTLLNPTQLAQCRNGLLRAATTA